MDDDNIFGFTFDEDFDLNDDEENEEAKILFFNSLFNEKDFTIPKLKELHKKMKYYMKENIWEDEEGYITEVAYRDSAKQVVCQEIKMDEWKEECRKKCNLVKRTENYRIRLELDEWFKERGLYDETKTI